MIASGSSPARRALAGDFGWLQETRVVVGAARQQLAARIRPR